MEANSKSGDGKTKVNIRRQCHRKSIGIGSFRALTRSLASLVIELRRSPRRSGSVERSAKINIPTLGRAAYS